MFRTALTAACLMLAGGTASAASTTEQIKAALVGNTFQGGMGGGAYSSYFGADGSYRDAETGGVYVIENNSVCYPGTEFGCYEATITGDQLEWFKDGKSEGTGTILPGNALNF